MISSWEALNARARGLATRLLGRSRIEELAGAPDLDALADALRAARIAPPEAAPTPEALEREVAAREMQWLGCLERWTESRDVLSVLFDGDDRRSLRRLLRGAAQGASPTVRLAGLRATPSFPRALLHELAAQSSPPAVVDRLVAHGHPLASPLHAAVVRGQTDLFHLEVALGRAFAERIRRCSRWASRGLKRYFAGTIDVENLWSALLARESAAAPFLEGGERLDRERFTAALRAEQIDERRRILAGGFAGTAIAADLADVGVATSQLEARILRTRIAEQVVGARLDPLGPAPFLGCVLRLRGETHDLRRVIWGTASGMPAAAIAEGLVTP